MGRVSYWPNTDTSQYYYEQPSYGNSYNDDPYNDMMRDIQNQQMRDLQRQQYYQKQLDRGDDINQSFYCSWITSVRQKTLHHIDNKEQSSDIFKRRNFGFGGLTGSKANFVAKCHKPAKSSLYRMT